MQAYGQIADVEVAVVGGGPAGFTAAIALASAGIDTALLFKRQPRPENRTSALLIGSVNALETLGVWSSCRALAAALRAIQIVDDSRRSLRSPEVRFAAAELGLEAFGYNIENRHLLAGLEGRAAALGNLRLLEGPAEAIVPAEDHVDVCYRGGGKLHARLVIGADGADSLCRSAARIPIRGFDCEQSALTVNFRHQRPHHETSTEFHTETGPFTLVPLPENRSSLVYVLGPGAAAHLARLPAGSLAQTIERRSHRLLGSVWLETDSSIFRLRVARVERFAARRIALIGEAAHVLPPIGAQGLNLGLRDAASIAELVVRERRRGRDIGSRELLRAYDAARRPDVMTRSLAVDLLNRSLLSEFLPVHALRGLALYLLDRVGPLRRALMREGMTPLFSQPSLMRGASLA